MKGLGPVQQKILILVMTGVGMGFCFSPTQHFRLIGIARKEWKKINKSSIERAVKRLYESRLIDMRLQDDGTWKMSLTQNGKKKALAYNIEKMRIPKPKKWDGKWRIIAFDIPERNKKLRDSFRGWMRRLGFYKLQESIFVYPYDCQDEFDFMVEFLRLRKFVRFIVATEIDNELDLKRRFVLK